MNWKFLKIRCVDYSFDLRLFQQEFLPTQHISGKLFVHISKWWGIHSTFVLEIVHKYFSIGNLCYKLGRSHSINPLSILDMRKYHISILGSLNRLPIILLLLLKYWVLILLQVGLINILLTLVISRLLRIFDIHRNYRYVLDFLLSILKFLNIN